MIFGGGANPRVKVVPARLIYVVQFFLTLAATQLAAKTKAITTAAKAIYKVNDVPFSFCLIIMMESSIFNPVNFEYLRLEI